MDDEMNSLLNRIDKPIKSFNYLRKYWMNKLIKGMYGRNMWMNEYCTNTTEWKVAVCGTTARNFYKLECYKVKNKWTAPLLLGLDKIEKINVWRPIVGWMNREQAKNVLGK